MAGSSIPHIGRVEWQAFKINKDRQAEWLRNPAHPADAATKCQEIIQASTIARLDQTVRVLRQRLRRKEGKLSETVDRGAASSEIVRRQRKVAKLRYLISEVQASKSRLLEKDVPVNLHHTFLGFLDATDIDLICPAPDDDDGLFLARPYAAGSEALACEKYVSEGFAFP